MARASARRCKSRDGLSFSCWPNSDRIIVCPLPQRRNFLEVSVVSSSVVRKEISAMVKVSSFATRAARASVVTALVLIAFAAAVAVPFTPLFGKWTRLSLDPILSPRGEGFESAGTFNPSVVKQDGKYVMLYRAQDHSGTSSLGYATSDDGIHWKRQGIIIPGYKGKWNVKWTKSGAIVPDKINGKYWMYYLADAQGKDSQMGVAYSEDLLHWTEALDHPVLSSRPASFDSQVVEPGPPPVIAPEGIFLIYNGADDKLVYSTGWVLFDKKDPTKVLARAQEPVFAPEKEWEKVGQVPNVVFVEGLVLDGKRWLFYYGGADKHVGVATAPVL